ncbi:hypothetical protein BJV82DRAFT_169031 [Fennellomyces sp. T-0311]|nr:hypothetical protein BJV82DRAFT_169031 [Fennellomyces sp. T-0311]
MIYSEGTTLSNLPAEIIQQIAAYLNTKDLGQCVCVSNSWNLIFRAFRHWSVKLTSCWQFSDFVKALERYAHVAKRRKMDNVPRVDNVGDYIYALHLEDGIMSIQDMKQLASLCPDITSICFRWNDNGKMFRTRKSLPGHHQFYSPATFFQHFHPASLICLDLNGPVSQLPADTISTVLRHFPQLESLTVTFDVFQVIPAVMEEFHDACPNLICLKVGWVSRPDDDYTIPFDMAQVVPAYALQSLSFPDAVSDHSRFCDGQWFEYIKHKYPSLTKLSIFHAGSFKNPLGRTRVEPSPIISTITLRDHWPHLKTLDLGAFASLPSSAYPRLVAGIPSVSLLDDPTMYFEEWINNDATNGLAQLTLRTLPRALDGITRCVHLRELYLGKKHGYLDNFQELPLEVVLSCPALEKLSISKCFIRHGNVTSQSRLKTLLMDKSVFDNNQVLAYLSERCRQLTHVSMNHCFWRSTDTYPIIRLWFPYQWFAFFCLKDPKIFSDIAKLDPPTNLVIPPTRSFEYTQARWRISYVTGINECFMLNTPEHHQESDLPLFWISETNSHPSVTVARINDADIMHYLHESQDGAKIQKAKEAMDRLRKSGAKQSHGKRWSTVLCCRGVARFHYNSGRVSMDHKGFIAVK